MDFTYTFMNIVTALLILILGVILGKVISNIMKKVFIAIKSAFFKKEKNKGLELTLTIIIKWVIYLIALILSLNQLGVSILTIKIIVIIIITLLLLFTLLTFKDFFPNLIAGVRLQRTKKLKIAKTLIMGSTKGKIIGFSLLETKIRNNRGEEIYLPNNLLLKEKYIIK